MRGQSKRVSYRYQTGLQLKFVVKFVAIPIVSTPAVPAKGVSLRRHHHHHHHQASHRDRRNRNRRQGSFPLTCSCLPAHTRHTGMWRATQSLRWHTVAAHAGGIIGWHALRTGSMASRATRMRARRSMHLVVAAEDVPCQRRGKAGPAQVGEHELGCEGVHFAELPDSGAQHAYQDCSGGPRGWGEGCLGCVLGMLEG
jgi:hypothetical protein